MCIGLSGLIPLDAIELPTSDTDASVEQWAGHPGQQILGSFSFLPV